MLRIREPGAPSHWPAAARLSLPAGAMRGRQAGRQPGRREGRRYLLSGVPHCVCYRSTNDNNNGRQRTPTETGSNDTSKLAVALAVALTPAPTPTHTYTDSCHCHCHPHRAAACCLPPICVPYLSPYLSLYLSVCLHRPSCRSDSAPSLSFASLRFVSPSAGVLSCCRAVVLSCPVTASASVIGSARLVVSSSLLQHPSSSCLVQRAPAQSAVPAPLSPPTCKLHQPCSSSPR